MDITLAGTGLTYRPNDDQLSRVTLEFAAFDGEVGNGQLPVPDTEAAITVAGGRLATVEEGATLIGNQYIVDQDRDRGPVPVGTARQYSFGVMDANCLLDGFVVLRTRPAELDRARVLAFAAIDLPSADTTMVINEATVTMPKKHYETDGGWAELISDTVEFTGKVLFLHDKAAGGLCLHYHLLTSGHTCGLTISDVAGAEDRVTVWAPWAPARQRTSVDLVNTVRGRDQAGRTRTASDPTSITAHNVDGLRHQRLVDFEAVSQSDLNVKTDAVLASQKNEQDTYTCQIGPLDEAALALIRVGDRVTVTSSVMGLTASVQRISHMTQTVAVGEGGRARPGWWMAALEMGAPVRRRRRGAAAKLKVPSIAITPTTVFGTGDVCANLSSFPGSWSLFTSSDFPITTLALGDTVEWSPTVGPGTPFWQRQATYTTTGILPRETADGQISGRIVLPLLVHPIVGVLRIGFAAFSAGDGASVDFVINETDDPAGGSLQDDTTYLFKWQVGPSTNRMKVWLATDPEPSTWDIAPGGLLTGDINKIAAFLLYDSEGAAFTFTVDQLEWCYTGDATAAYYSIWTEPRFAATADGITATFPFPALPDGGILTAKAYVNGLYEPSTFDALARTFTFVGIPNVGDTIDVAWVPIP